MNNKSCTAANHCLLPQRKNLDKSSKNQCYRTPECPNKSRVMPPKSWWVFKAYERGLAVQKLWNIQNSGLFCWHRLSGSLRVKSSVSESGQRVKFLFLCHKGSTVPYHYSKISVNIGYVGASSPWLTVQHRGQRTGCLLSPNLICRVCLMQQGGDVCWGWIRLNILPHNSHPCCTNTEWDKSENYKTMKRNLSNSWTNKQTLMLEATLSSFPSSFKQKTKKKRKEKQFKQASRWWFSLSLKKVIKANRTGLSREEATCAQPLTSGIFIVSGEQLFPFLVAILNTFYSTEWWQPRAEFSQAVTDTGPYFTFSNVYTCVKMNIIYSIT